MESQPLGPGARLLYACPAVGVPDQLPWPTVKYSAIPPGGNPWELKSAWGEYLHQGKQKIRSGFLFFFFFFLFSPESQFTSILLSHPEPRILLSEPKQQLSAKAPPALLESLSLRSAGPAGLPFHMQSGALIGPTHLSRV